MPRTVFTNRIRSVKALKKRRKSGYRMMLSTMPRFPTSLYKRGAMTITRNAPAYYIGPGATLGTPQQAGGLTLWQIGGATAAGGIVPGLYDCPFVKAFQLNDLINTADFSGLFDQYCIKKVVITVRITQYASAAALGAGAAIGTDSLLAQPMIFWFHDQDDNNLPSVTDIRERMGVRSKMLTPSRPVRIVCYPKPDGPLYNASGALTGAQIPKGRQWLDVNIQNIPHYGIKGMIAGMDLRSTTGGVPGYQITFETKYTIALKDVR